MEIYQSTGGDGNDTRRKETVGSETAVSIKHIFKRWSKSGGQELVGCLRYVPDAVWMWLVSLPPTERTASSDRDAIPHVHHQQVGSLISSNAPLLGGFDYFREVIGL